MPEQINTHLIEIKIRLAIRKLLMSSERYNEIVLNEKRYAINFYELSSVINTLARLESTRCNINHSKVQQKHMQRLYFDAALRVAKTYFDTNQDKYSFTKNLTTPKQTLFAPYYTPAEAKTPGLVTLVQHQCEDDIICYKATAWSFAMTAHASAMVLIFVLSLDAAETNGLFYLLWLPLLIIPFWFCLTIQLLEQFEQFNSTIVPIYTVYSSDKILTQIDNDFRNSFFSRSPQSIPVNLSITLEDLSNIVNGRFNLVFPDDKATFVIEKKIIRVAQIIGQLHRSADPMENFGALPIEILTKIALLAKPKNDLSGKQETDMILNNLGRPQPLVDSALLPTQSSESTPLLMRR